MSRKRFTPEQIIGKLREAEVALTAEAVEKPQILVFLPCNLLISLDALFEKTAEMDFFDSFAIYPRFATRGEGC